MGEVFYLFNILTVSNILTRWIAQYQLPGAGNFSYKPHGDVPHPYSPSDVLHVLCFTDQLNLTDQEKSKWAAGIQAFQDPKTGFFNNKDSEGMCAVFGRGMVFYRSWIDS